MARKAAGPKTPKAKAPKRKAPKAKAPKRAAPKNAPKRARAVASDPSRRCGLCGKTSNLTHTPCCGHWICDDEHTYVLFSYARNSCHRNHDRYTLCSFHANEGHAGRWQECEKCRDSFKTEMYVWLGTNEYNFEKLPNPPSFEPTRCSQCGKVIHLGEGGYSVKGVDYRCWECTREEIGDLD